MSDTPSRSWAARLLQNACAQFTTSKAVDAALVAAAGALALKLVCHLYYVRGDPVVYVTYEEVKDKVYDFIVIGSGTAGSCVAGVLARDGRRPKVLLLEAGGPDNYHHGSAQVIPLFTQKNQLTAVDWGYLSEPQARGCGGMVDNRSKWPRGKVMGGSSVLNYMMWVRGNKQDYDDWCYKHGCTGWAYHDILPYYREMERCLFDIPEDLDRRCHGFDGLQPIWRRPDAHQHMTSKLFVAACKNQGFAYNATANGDSQDGVSYTEYTINGCGRRATSFRAYVASLFGENGREADIDVLPHAHVSRILTERDAATGGNVAVGVELWGGHPVRVDHARGGEVICSGGAVGSPQLLLLSGIGARAHLAEHGIPCVADVPGVGQNLRDHFAGFFYSDVDLAKFQAKHGKGVTTGALGARDFNILGALWRYFVSHSDTNPSELVSSGLDVQLFCQSDVAKAQGAKTNDLQIIAGNVMQDPAPSKHSLESFNLDPEKTRRFKPKHAKPSKSNVCFLLVNNQPKSVGELTLKSGDYRDHPAIQPNYLSHEDDKKVFASGFEIAQRIASDRVYADSGYTPQDYAEVTREEYKEGFIENNLLTLYHPVGTCKMGSLDDDPSAVCDPHLKVRSFTNLRVMDASVIPYLPSGNTQAPCYLVGVKGAAMALQDWRRYAERGPPSPRTQRATGDVAAAELPSP